MPSETKPILIALDDNYDDSHASIRQLAEAVADDFDIHAATTFATGQQIAHELCSDSGRCERTKAVLLDMQLEAGERRGDDYIAFLRGELRLGVPILIVSGYSLNEMNDDHHKPVPHGGTFEDEDGYTPGTGFFANCFYFFTSYIEEAIEKLEAFRDDGFPPRLGEAEMERIYQNSGYTHRANLQKAKDLRKQILTPFEYLANGLQAFYGGNREIFQNPSIRNYLLDLAQCLTESQAAFEKLIHLPNPDYQSYGSVRVEKVFSTYDNPFLNQFVEALRDSTAETFLEDGEEKAKAFVDFVIDKLGPELQTIVKFIGGGQL